MRTVCLVPRCAQPAVYRGRCQRHVQTTTQRGYGADWRAVRSQILERDKGVCWRCGLPGATEVDHVIPLAHGGSRLDQSNLRAAHKACNSAAGGRTRRR